ncbi:hypothetical protein RIF29_38951 [Crotalaria pallida]|uniref:peroxidase n=1 Tax=Crotalaria pallida TaxID=3830 RepID=A0AAN9E3A4_CROPI
MPYRHNLDPIVRDVFLYFFLKFFVPSKLQGCDASILMDGITSEQTAGPNAGTIRGLEVIDKIKLKVESIYPGVLGGPSWAVPLGRRDAMQEQQTIANNSAANNEIPSPLSDLPTLKSMFEAKGLSPSDLTVLSDAHTIGQTECRFFRSRIYNECHL